MKKTKQCTVGAGLAGVVAALLPGAAAAASSVNMPVGVSETSRSVYDLHMLILWVCVVIGVGVFGTILWSIIHHRKSIGHEPASFHENTKLEIVWTLIPVLILIGMAWPATSTLIDMYDTGGEDLAVEVRGYQWRWQYKYLDEDLNSQFSFFSSMTTPAEEIQGQAAKGQYYLLEVDNPLRIPVDRKVRFLLTAEDVIHAWWVPDFGLKKDAVPGMLNEMWTRVDQPGIYRGQCAELCGKDHAFMPVVVQAMPQEEYDAWYAEQLEAAKAREAALSQTFSEEELMTEGQQIYNTFCASCHQPNGQGLPPVFPAIAGSPVATGPREEHIDIVVNGVPGTAMQAFGRQLDAAQIAAVVHYQRHAFGNNTGDTTQPADVVARQQAQ